jgi:hypothetical protein
MSGSRTIFFFLPVVLEMTPKPYLILSDIWAKVAPVGALYLEEVDLET